ncbi:hypothetical protein [Micromonospora sp. NPDC005367]|uniref:hypothetical protein n=1 Tax=Micromonospora sp. NPDC005367 TaxID=3155590 RepID=UPI0033A5EB11
MPSFAPADPLWWVARWATRLLASLAVVGALTLGSLSALGVPPHTGAAVEPRASTDSRACDCATGSAGTSSSPAVVVADDAPAEFAVAFRTPAESAASRVAPSAAHGATSEVFASAAPVADPVTVPAGEAWLPRSAVAAVRAPRAPPGA